MTGFTGSRRELLELFKFDPLSRAIQVISEEHFLIHQGRVFNAFGNEQDVPDGASRFWTFRVGATPVHFKRVTIGASEGPVLIRVTENPTITTIGTLAQNVVNLNRLSSVTPEMTIFTDTVASAAGDPVLGDLYVPQNGNNGVTGESGAIEEFILMPNTDYLFELQNDPAGSGNADIYINLVFYEIGYDDQMGDPFSDGRGPYPNTGP